MYSIKYCKTNSYRLAFKNFFAAMHMKIYFALEICSSQTKHWNLNKNLMNRLFEFGLKNIDGLRSFRSSIVSKSSGEHLRTAIMIDSTIVDQKPGRRNVRFIWDVIFSKLCNFAGFWSCLLIKLLLHTLSLLPGSV